MKPSVRDSLAAVLTASLLASAAAAQDGAPGGEWPVYGGDPGHTRYAPLEQIDRDNVGDLEIAWRWSARNFGPNPFARNTTTPLMVDGVLYATAGVRRSVVAIDAGTGETLWMWRMDEGERLEGAPRANSGRGVAYWSDGMGDERIFVITPGYHLVALDAATGYPVRGFGDDGVVDLMKGLRPREGVDPVGSIGASSPPLVAGDLLVVGAALHVGSRPPSRVNIPGDVRGFDARTGALVWTFRTIPEPGEPGNETWLEDSWSYTGNAAVWAPMSYDPETGYVYLPTEAPTGDFYGGHRPGDNLYSTSVVCLDARTGERVWHFQTIHHDIWDWDNPTAPILADLVIDGTPRRVVIQLTKQSFAYVFDRVTGEPVWPIEERPVPASDVPGEWTAPTQPFPTRPAPYDRQGVSEDDLLDFTPEIRARALEVARDFRMGPIFTPPSLREGPDGKMGTLMLPSGTGGSNWEAGAFDPETGYLYVGSQTNIDVISLESDTARSDMRYIRRFAGASIARGVPLVKPPWGRITAIDMSTGEHVWMTANGDTPPRVATALELDPALLPRTGKVSRAGVLVTRTLLFAGEGLSGDPVFRAHDKATGEILAEIEIPGTQTGLPMTYMHEGRQYVVLAVGDNGIPSEIVALALPR